MSLLLISAAHGSDYRGGGKKENFLQTWLQQGEYHAMFGVRLLGGNKGVGFENPCLIIFWGGHKVGPCIKGWEGVASSHGGCHGEDVVDGFSMVF